MSFLLHSDEHGWLQGWVHDFSAPVGEQYRPMWIEKRSMAYRGTSRKVLEDMKIPNAVILEWRE